MKNPIMQYVDNLIGEEARKTEELRRAKLEEEELRLTIQELLEEPTEPTEPTDNEPYGCSVDRVDIENEKELTN